MRILVTGSAGFLGDHLCNRLLADGHEVIGVDGLVSPGARGRFDRARYVKYACHVQAMPAQYVERVDRVYHLACPASPPVYQRMPAETIEASVIGTARVLAGARFHRARVLLTSSSEVYGDPKIHPQHEDYFGNVNPIGVRSCYDEGKRAAEALMYAWQREYKSDVRVARIFNTYGPGMDPDDGRAVPTFIRQALRNEPITVHGLGMQTRSLCYVDDMVDGLIKLMEGHETRPVNLGNPEEITVMELAETVRAIVGSKSPITSVDATEDDPKRRRPSIECARASLGWEPQTPLSVGLRKTIDWFKENLR